MKRRPRIAPALPAADRPFLLFVVLLPALLAAAPAAAMPAATPALRPAAAPAPLDGGHTVVLEALLAAEFARAGGDGAAMAGWALQAARASRDPALAGFAAEAALQADDAARAAAALARWQALEPASIPRDRLALRLHITQADIDDATRSALRLLALPDGVDDVVAGLEAPYADGGVIARAVLRALRVAPAFPPRIEAWLAMAGLAQRLDDEALSAAWVDDLVRRFANDPRARLLRAERLAKRGERDAARGEVRLLLADAALPAEQRRIAAEALAVLGDPAAAAQALARGPQDARSLTLRASWLARAGDLEGLRRLFAEAETVATPAAVANEPALPLLLGELAERLQDWPAAERWYGQLRQGEAGERARLRLGIVLGRQQRFDAALAALRALQQDDAVDGAVRRDAFIAEADQFESRRQRAAADAALDRGLAILEDDPALRVARAQLARTAGRLAEAEADLRAVLERDPDHAPALRALGALELARGQPAAAEPLFARAWRVAPGAPTAAAWGEALWLLGRTADARDAWARGAALDPADPVLADTRERFGQ